MRLTCVCAFRWIVPLLAPALFAAGCAGFAVGTPSTSVSVVPTTAAVTSTVIISQPTATIQEAVRPMTATVPVDMATTRIASPSGTMGTPGASPLGSQPPLGTPTVAPVGAQQPASLRTVLYQDDFKNSKSGWPDELLFQDYFVGYHEPDFYHVEVHAPNDSAIVTAPGQTFDNFSAETRVQISAANTAPNGDFRYGLALRRAGNRYYAFAISPRTKTWYVLKSSSGKLQVLGQGTQDSIRGLQAQDTLRVNAQGPLLTFFVNGQPVSQINDPDYASGGVGFYVETFDSPKAHIHYDSLIISQPENLPAQPVASPTLQAPLVRCTVMVDLLRLRPSPEISNEPSIAGLFMGTQLDALARSTDGTWIRVRIHGSSQEGWVSSEPALIACNGLFASLPEK